MGIGHRRCCCCCFVALLGASYGGFVPLSGELVIAFTANMVACYGGLLLARAEYCIAAVGFDFLNEIVTWEQSVGRTQNITLGRGKIH